MLHITIKETATKLTPEMKEYLEKKAFQLEKFLNYKDEAPLWIEVERTTNHHQKGYIFRAELQMRLPRASLRSEALREDIREAIDEATKEMERKIKDWKEEQIAKHRRGINKEDLGV